MSNDMRFLHDMLVRMNERMDDLVDAQNAQAQISARHEENLKLHMKRSDANEEAIELLKRHVNMVNGVGAFLVFLGIVASIYAVFKG